MQSSDLVIDVTVGSSIVETPRIKQLSGMFDVPAQEKLTRQWSGSLPLQAREWKIGLIVGPSGAGKSTLLQRIAGKPLDLQFGQTGGSVIDDFSPKLSIQQIASACNSVGFNTIPSWMKPYSVLSNGEKFRVETARRILETTGDMISIDEFTSVVDRQVAQIAANSVAKFVRASDKKMVAATCHYDVIDWLQPDWTLEPDTMTFRWRSLCRRPQLKAQVVRIEYQAWQRFAPYHYLTAELARGAVCFGLVIDGQIVAFGGVLHFPHAKVRNIKRLSRLVVMPDWQGLGLAFHLTDTIASAYKAMGYELRTYPAHPALVRSFDKSPKYQLVKEPGGF